MNISVVRPHALGPAELGAWRDMQRSSPELSNPFLAPNFTLALGRLRAGVRVAVLEDSGQPVGFFPFERGRARVGRALAVGVSDCQGVIHAPGLEWSMAELLRGSGLDVLEFDHLTASQLTAVGPHVTRRSSPVIDISRGYDAYVAERLRGSRKIFKSTLYKQRKLERDFGETRFEFDSRDGEALRLLMRWKSAQYRRTGRRDRFAIPWIERLVWDLFETRAEGCCGTLSVVYSSQGVVAAHFGLRSESTLSCWFPAYDVGLGTYSPGLCLHLQMAEAAADAGVRCLDLGKGAEDYKQSLKSGDLSVGEGWVEVPSFTAAMRRIQRTPRRLTFDLISRYPGLRRGAREALKRVGSVRGRV